MKSFKVLFASLALLLVATATNAQSVDSNSNSNAGSSSGSVSQLQLTQNTSGQVQYSGHFSQTQNAQVPISVVGYSSFSPNNCSSSIGGGATTRLFSIVYNGPKTDVTCQHIVAADGYGRATQMAMVAQVPDMARSSLSMIYYKLCTISEEDKQACIARGLVVPTGKVSYESHGLFHRKTAVVEVIPASVLPPGADAMLGQLGQFGTSIPSRPQGWSGVAGQPDYRNNQGAQAQQPSAAPIANPQASVMPASDVPPPSAAIAGTYNSVVPAH